VGEGPGGGVEWSGSSVIVLGGNDATAINDAGQVVGDSFDSFGRSHAIEWSGGKVINLGRLPSSLESFAFGINDAGQVVGYSSGIVPEPSTWAMVLFGFAGLAFAGYRRAKAGHEALPRLIG
jgi:probable HAF family extracellular repeat protein